MELNEEEVDWMSVAFLPQYAKPGVYMITNNVDGRVYIGSSYNVARRWYEHQRTLNKRTHRNSRLQDAWDEFGGEVFTISILHECPVSELRAKEQELLDAYRSYEEGVGYNICANSRDSTGFRHSDETRSLLSRLAQKRVDSGTSPLTKYQFSKGTTLSEDMRRKISEGHKGVHAGEKHPGSVLRDSDIPVILERLGNGETCASIARSYGVSGRAISLIKSGKNWTHITKKGG